MKRLLFFGAIPFFGCADSFFVTIDLGLDTRDLNLLAVDIAEVEQIEVLATPNDDTEPQSFVIGDIPRFPPEGFISYALELPKDLETIPLQLDHRAFSVDPNITEPFLFGTVSVATENGQRSGLVLSARAPNCNNVDDRDEFCFSAPLKTNISSSHDKMIATNLLQNNIDPIVMIASNSTNALRAFAVSASGLQENSNLSLSYPIQNVELFDMTILDPGAQTTSLALLQNGQIFIRFPGGGPELDFAAPAVNRITSASLNVLPGRDIAAITNNSLQFFLNNTGASGFDAPITFPFSAGNPRFVKLRRSGNADQIVVASENPAQVGVFDFFNNSIRQLGGFTLPANTVIADVAVADMNGDGFDDVIIADNGPAKKVIIAITEANGNTNNLTEIPVSGVELQAITLGRFDNNPTLDIAVSGRIGVNFTQFILSNGATPKVTAPRAVGNAPRFLVPVKIGTPGQAESLLVETTGENSLDLLMPEL
jgi:hypothetical protein